MLPPEKHSRRAVRRAAQVVAALAAGLVAVATFATPASALGPVSGDWSPARPLIPLDEGSGQSKSDAIVVTNARGDSASIWTEFPYTPGAAPYVVHYVSQRPAGGEWSVPRSVVERATGSADVAIDDVGAVVVVWTEASDDSGESVAVWTRRVGRNGTFGARQRVSQRGVVSAAPRVAMSPAGRVAIGWRSGGQIVARTGTIGDLGAADVLGPRAGEGATVDVDVADSGAATFTWTSRGTASPGVYSCLAAARSARCGDATRVNRSRSVAAVAPDVDVSPDGAAVICFGYRARPGQIRYAVRSTTGGWSRPRTATQGQAATVSSCQVETRPHGTALLAYTDGADRLFSRTMTRTATGEPQPASGGKIYEYSLTAGRGGAVALIYGDTQVTLASVLTAGQTEFPAPTTIRFADDRGFYDVPEGTAGVDLAGNAYLLALVEDCPAPRCQSYPVRPWTALYQVG